MPAPLKRTVWAILLGYTLLHLTYSIVQYSILEGTSSGDFNRAYLETGEWRSSLARSPDQAAVWHFHPPFYYAILAGADSMLGGMRASAYFFYLIQFLLFPIAIAALVRAVWSGPARPPWAAYGVAAVLAVNFQPFLETLAQHKVEGIELVLICLAILAFRRRRDLLCGGLLMAAANLKYLPALLLAHFALKREWRVLWGAGAGVVLAVGVACAAFGPRVLSSGFLGQAAALMLDHRHEGNIPAASVEMQTLSGTVNRWLARPEPPRTFLHYLTAGSYMPVQNPRLAFGIAGALKILAVLGWLFFLRRRWRREEREERWPLHLLEISLTLAMIFVIAQASRVHYSILALPAFVTAGMLLYQRRRIFRMREKCLFGLAYALTGMVIPGGLLNRLPPHPVWHQSHSWMFLWWSLPFYGIVLLGLCAVLMHGRLRAGAGIARPS